jgi:hypothetical protein
VFGDPFNNLHFWPHFLDLVDDLTIRGRSM